MKVNIMANERRQTENSADYLEEGHPEHSLSRALSWDYRSACVNRLREQVATADEAEVGY